MSVLELLQNCFLQFVTKSFLDIKQSPCRNKDSYTFNL